MHEFDVRASRERRARIPGVASSLIDPIQILVCKIGGSIIEDVNPSIMDDIKRLQALGTKIILVHGGGEQVTKIAEKLGKKQRFVTSPDGIKSRYTDKETVEIFTMVMSGLLSKKIIQNLLANGIKAISLTGMDGALLLADRKEKLVIVDDRGRKFAIEGGYTGKVAIVNTDLLSHLLSLSLVPVVSPVAAERKSWSLLNVDGDRACSHIAGAMKADVSMFLTDTEGLILNNNLVRAMSAKEAKDVLPSIGSGMDKKVLAAVEAVEMGSRKSIIASGLRQNPIENALAGGGTTITPELNYA
jgi:acetylglutamate/LysW-gamma-L-alpha-aminoadipate kinase